MGHKPETCRYKGRMTERTGTSGYLGKRRLILPKGCQESHEQFADISKETRGGWETLKSF